MAQVQPIIRVEIDPTKPVQEICAVIMAVTPYHPGQEAEILRGVQEAIDRRMKQITKGDENDGESVRESSQHE